MYYISGVGNMKSTIKSVRVNDNVLSLLEEYFSISSDILGDKGKPSFTELVNLSLSSLLGHYAEGLEDLGSTGEYYERDKSGALVKKVLSDEEKNRIKQFVDSAIGYAFIFDL